MAPTPGRPVPSQGPSFRSLLIAVAVLIGAVMIAAQAAVAIYAGTAFREALAPEVQRRAEIVGRGIADRIAFAIGLGIPLEDLVGMETFLDQALDQTPRLRYLAVTDGGGRILFARTRGGTDVAAVLGTGPEPGSGARARPAAAPVDAVDTALPIRGPNGRVGTLHVGTERDPVNQHAATDPVTLLGLFAVAMVITIEGLGLLLLGVYLPRWQRVAWVMDRAAVGDFTWRPPPEVRGAVGRLSRAVALVIARMSERHEELISEAREIAAGQIDRTVPARIEVTVRTACAPFRFAAPGQEAVPAVENTVRLRLALVLLLIAAAIALAGLPSLSAALADAGATARTPLIAAPVAVAVAVAALIAAAVPLSWLVGADPRRLFGVGAVVAASGCAVAPHDPTFDALMLATAAIGAGVGLGLLATRVRVAAGAAAVGAVAAPVPLILSASAMALIAGPALSESLLRWGGTALPWTGAAVLALGAAAAALTLYAPVVEPAAPPDDREIDAEIDGDDWRLGASEPPCMPAIAPTAAHRSASDPAGAGAWSAQNGRRRPRGVGRAGRAGVAAGVWLGLGAAPLIALLAAAFGWLVPASAFGAGGLPALGALPAMVFGAALAATGVVVGLAAAPIDPTRHHDPGADPGADSGADPGGRAGSGWSGSGPAVAGIALAGGGAVVAGSIATPAGLIAGAAVCGIGAALGVGAFAGPGWRSGPGARPQVGRIAVAAGLSLGVPVAALLAEAVGAPAALAALGVATVVGALVIAGARAVAAIGRRRAAPGTGSGSGSGSDAGAGAAAGTVTTPGVHAEGGGR